MTLNRLITSLVQLGMFSVVWYCGKAIYHDIKENGFFPEEEN